MTLLIDSLVVDTSRPETEWPAVSSAPSARCSGSGEGRRGPQELLEPIADVLAVCREQWRDRLATAQATLALPPPGGHTRVRVHSTVAQEIWPKRYEEEKVRVRSVARRLAARRSGRMSPTRPQVVTSLVFRGFILPLLHGAHRNGVFTELPPNAIAEDGRVLVLEVLSALLSETPFPEGHSLACMNSLMVRSAERKHNHLHPARVQVECDTRLKASMAYVTARCERIQTAAPPLSARAEPRRPAHRGSMVVVYTNVRCSNAKKPRAAECTHACQDAPTTDLSNTHVPRTVCMSLGEVVSAQRRCSALSVVIHTSHHLRRPVCRVCGRCLRPAALRSG